MAIILASLPDFSDLIFYLLILHIYLFIFHLQLHECGLKKKPVLGQRHYE